MRRSSSRLTSGRRSTPRTTLKMAALAPMPRARVRTTVIARPLLRQRERTASLRSRPKSSGERVTGAPFLVHRKRRTTPGVSGILHERILIGGGSIKRRNRNIELAEVHGELSAMVDDVIEKHDAKCVITGHGEKSSAVALHGPGLLELLVGDRGEGAARIVAALRKAIEQFSVPFDFWNARGRGLEYRRGEDHEAKAWERGHVARHPCKRAGLGLWLPIPVGGGDPLESSLRAGHFLVEFAEKQFVDWHMESLRKGGRYYATRQSATITCKMQVIME